MANKYRDRVLDRVPQFDARSRGFAAIAPDDTRPFRSHRWACDTYLDQGQEGACVGFGWTHELAAKPQVVVRDEAFAFNIYHLAQKKYDPYPGEDYSGTSVLAGVKAVQEFRNTLGKQYIREYRWAFGIQDVVKVLGYHGPVVLGINWYDGMYDPDENGYIHVLGPKVGGHCILAVGTKIVKKNWFKSATWDNVDMDKSRVRLHNSWGRGYGIGGDAFISLSDLSRLLDEDGEAVVVTARSGDV